MDALLAGLERSTWADPTDPILRRSLVRAYGRAGRDAEAYLELWRLDVPPADLGRELARTERPALEALGRAEGVFAATRSAPPDPHQIPCEGAFAWRGLSDLLEDGELDGPIVALCLGEVRRLDDSAAAQLRKLQALTFVHLGAIADERLLAALGELPGLGGVSAFHTELNTAALVGLAQSASLRSLDLCWASGLTSEGLSALSQVPRLEDLNLKRCALTDEMVEPLSRCRTLQRVSLAGNPELTAASVRALARCSDLEAIDLSACRYLDDWAIRPLAQLARLRTLTLDRCPRLTGDFVADFAGSTLERLRVGNDSPSPSSPGDVLCLYLADLPKLEGLTIPATGLTGEGLRDLTCASGIRQLALTGRTTRIERDDLVALEALPALEEVLLGATDFDDVALFALATCERLQSFRAFGAVTEVGLRFLVAAVPSLRSVQLAQGLAITDRAAADMARLPELEEIQAWQCSEITDAGLEHLLQSPKLRRLHLYQARELSQDARHRARRWRPDLEVVC